MLLLIVSLIKSIYLKKRRLQKVVYVVAVMHCMCGTSLDMQKIVL